MVWVADILLCHDYDGEVLVGMVEVCCVCFGVLVKLIDESVMKKGEWCEGGV